jgi:hypothetical protein
MQPTFLNIMCQAESELQFAIHKPYKIPHKLIHQCYSNSSIQAFHPCSSKHSPSCYGVDPSGCSGPPSWRPASFPTYCNSILFQQCGAHREGTEATGTKGISLTICGLCRAFFVSVLQPEVRLKSAFFPTLLDFHLVSPARLYPAPDVYRGSLSRRGSGTFFRRLSSLMSPFSLNTS